MKRNYFIASLLLIVSLAIYLFYRTESTLATKIFISCFSYEIYDYIKSGMPQELPFHEITVYSLPGALWVFFSTIVSSLFYLKLRNKKIGLKYLPIFLALAIEVSQLLNFTKGIFDINDIILVILFWLIALFIIPKSIKIQDVLKPITVHAILAILSLFIVLLAKVW